MVSLSYNLLCLRLPAQDSGADFFIATESASERSRTSNKLQEIYSAPKHACESGDVHRRVLIVGMRFLPIVCVSSECRTPRTAPKEMVEIIRLRC